MKRYMYFPVFAFFILMMGCFAFAQTSDIPLPPASNNEVMEAFVALIGGAKGASVLVIVGLVGQLFAKLVLSPLWDNLKLDPKWKFLVFAITQFIATIVPMMVGGMSTWQAITSGAVLLLVVQYGHRIYELFFETKKPVVIKT